MRKPCHFRARWYEPVLGRFVVRDPLRYVDGPHLYRSYFVPNGIDPIGLLKIAIQVDAFISYAWVTFEPGMYYLLGDARDVSATPLGPEASRAYQRIVIELEECVRRDPLISSESDISFSAAWSPWSPSMHGPLITVDKGTFSAPISARRLGPCSVEVTLQMQATIPRTLVPFAPSINWDFTFTVQACRNRAGSTSIQGTVQGKHDGFPAYEAYVDSTLVYSFDPRFQNTLPTLLKPLALFGHSDQTAISHSFEFVKNEHLACQNCVCDNVDTPERRLRDCCAIVCIDKWGPYAPEDVLNDCIDRCMQNNPRGVELLYSPR